MCPGLYRCQSGWREECPGKVAGPGHREIVPAQAPDGYMQVTDLTLKADVMTPCAFVLRWSRILTTT